MTKKILSITILFIFSILYTFGKDNNIDSLLNKSIKIQKPYIVINLFSKDCINCKSNAFSLFDGFCTKKIIILSDSRLMKSYLQRNSLLSASIKFLFNKPLSNALSKNGLSSVALIQENKVSIYGLNSAFESNVAYIKSIINPSCNEVTNQVHKQQARSNTSAYLTNNEKFNGIKKIHSAHLKIMTVDLR